MCCERCMQNIVENVNIQQLKIISFHLQVKEKHQPIFPANDTVITSVVTFIKSLADVSNLDWIARQVFKSEKVNLADVTEKLKQAVEHYSSSPNDDSSAPQSPGIAPGNTRLAITKAWFGRRTFHEPNLIH